MPFDIMVHELAYKELAALRAFERRGQGTSIPLAQVEARLASDRVKKVDARSTRGKKK